METRSDEHRAGRGGIPHRHRYRTTAEGAQFRAARGAFFGEGLSVDRPHRRRPCGTYTRARRLLADAGVSRDCRSTSPTCSTEVVSTSNQIDDAPGLVAGEHNPARTAKKC